MQRKHVLAYLLFSLFLFLLLSSCFSPSSGELTKLVADARYGELERLTASMLAKRIDAKPLFYRSVALQQLDRKEDAYHVLNLYFGMAEGDDEHLVDAHRLMSSLSLEVTNPIKGIASARWLEQLSLLTEKEAQAYYQALLMAGETTEAERVFAQYLKDTIEPYLYAKMVLGSFSDTKKIEEAFASLSQQDKLRLLQSIASVTLGQERAHLVLSLATPLEQAFEGRVELVQVYRLLETLYGYADVRVQQRKYSSLAQNFR